LNKIQRLLLAVKWEQVGDVTLRVVIWLLLGSVINLIPILAAYLTEAGQESAQGGYSLTTALSSGDLLLAATVMLPPTLADLALIAKKARRTRIIVIILGALLSFFSLLIYGYAFANNLDRENGQVTVAANLGPNSVAHLSIIFFLAAVFIGAVCAGFLAGETSTSVPGEEPPGTATPKEEAG
jgi:hypothetical protein